MSLENRIRILEDKESVKQLMRHYALTCDKGYPPDEMMAHFSDDFVMEFGEPVGDYRGEQVEQFWKLAPSINVQPRHYMMSPLIDISEDGKSARGSIYLWEATTQFDSDSNPIPVWAAGVYDNEFKKVDGVWKISVIRLRFETLCSMEAGWVAEKIREMNIDM